jgi:prepilin-type N-terminal cleavage/methylation domain-containing protein
MMQMSRTKVECGSGGFTLIELMLVVTILGIVTAIAVPALSRARGAASEAQTIGSLRAIHGAQVSYATSCGNGYYAPSMPWLSRSPAAGQPGFIGREFSANTTDRPPYRIRFTLGTRAKQAKKTCNGLAAGQAATTYFIAADLLDTKNGMLSRYFGVNQEGVIYQSRKRISPFYDGPAKAPASLLQ